MDLSNPTQFSQNARLAISKFDRIKIEGVRYRFSRETEAGFVLLRDDETQLAHQFSHKDMQRLTNAHRIRVDRGHFDPEFAAKRQLHANTAYGGLTAGVKTRLSKREAYVQAALEMHNEGLMSFTDVSIKANVHVLMGRAMGLVDNLNPSGKAKLPKTEDFSKPPAARTLRRWLAAVNEFGRSGLVDRIDSRGNRASNLGPEASGLMMKEVRKYLSPERPSIEQVHEDVVLGFEKRNEERKAKGLHPLTVPSRETVRRAIRALDPYQVELARNGEAAARKKFRPVMNGISVTRPLERVEIDEWTVDVITFLQSTGMYALMSDEDKRSLGLYVEDEQDLDDPKLRKKLGRWTLTAAICCATRCIVGMVLSRNPGSEAAVQLLEMITTIKGAWSDAVGALTSWDMHGTPELIVFDGGAAFKSQRFRMAVNDLGVMWEMAMNGVPENRGTIERVFRTFATDFAPRLSGHTFNSIVEKGDADPEARAALSLDDFTFALIRWVTDIYHNTPHGGLDGETPVKAWRRLSQEYGVPSSPDMEMMRLCFGQERQYVLEKNGITILGVRYQSEALQEHMRRKNPHEVDVRWHPKDIGAISVRIGKAWFEIPALDSSLNGVAAQTWLTAVRHTKSANPKAKDVRARLGDLDALPSVAQAERAAKDVVAKRLAELERQQKEQARIKAAQLAQKKERQARAHREHRAKLDAQQKANQAQERAERNARLRKGLAGLLDRITGKRRKTIAQNEFEAKRAVARDQRQVEQVTGHQKQSKLEVLSKEAILRKQFKASRRELVQDIQNLTAPTQEEPSRDVYMRKRKRQSTSPRPKRSHDRPEVSR